VYNFADASAEATMYYRLKQVDIDGTYEYFDIIRINSDCDDDTGTVTDVFPNPVVTEHEAFIKLVAPTTEAVHIDVMNATGALVSQTKTNVSEGPNLLNFPIDKLAAGTYFIRVRGGSWLSNANKFIKLNE